MTLYNLHDGDIELVYERRGRKKGYWLGDEKVVRVTEVSTPIPFQAAAMYGSKMAAEKLKQLIDEESVEGLETKATVVGFSLSDWAEKIRKAPLDTTARDRGTLGHQWIECWFKDEPLPKVDDELQAMLDKFVEWFKERSIPLIMASSIEAKLYSKKYHYAGTMDCSWVFKESGNFFHELVDFKLGAIRPSVRTQTAAYMQARQEEGHKYDRRRVVSITEDGVKTEVFEDFEADFAAFKNLLSYHRWANGSK